MELFDEDLMKNEKTDSKKATTIILVLIIFLIIMILLVIGVIIYLKQTSLVIKLNGQESSAIKNMIQIDENNPKNVYVPIREFSKIIEGYTTHTGNYVLKSEEINECYVESQDEIAMFKLNSNIIYKTLNDGELNFEYFVIDEVNDKAVKSINGELYTTIDGIEKAFNVSWEYNLENNKMEIYTMPYLISAYSKYVTDYGYDTVSQNFTNQKAILDGFLVVEQGTSENNKKVAVLDVNEPQAKTLLEPKYEEIEYLQHTNDFLITSNEKKGIISKSKKTIVKPQYEDIELLDFENKLYLVKKSNKYGVINFSGEKVIPIEFNEIGIDITQFKENGLKSKYVLAGNLIPLKYNDKWGFFDVRGKQATNFDLEGVGYITTNNKAGTGYSLVVDPNYNVIVVKKDDKYNVITSDGKEVSGFGFYFTSIYLSIFGDSTSYVLERDSKTWDLEEELDKIGLGKSNNQNEEITEEEDNDNNSTEINESEDESTNVDENGNIDENTVENEEEDE